MPGPLARRWRCSSSGLGVQSATTRAKNIAKPLHSVQEPLRKAAARSAGSCAKSPFRPLCAGWYILRMTLCCEDAAAGRKPPPERRKQGPAQPKVMARWQGGLSRTGKPLHTDHNTSRQLPKAPASVKGAFALERRKIAGHPALIFFTAYTDVSNLFCCS